MTDRTRLDDLVARARRVTLAEFAETIGGLKRQGAELVGPCPACGGRDGFALHLARGLWHCRRAALGGNDAISLAAHALDLDTKSRAGFLAACAEALGEPLPDDGESASPPISRRPAREPAPEPAREANPWREAEIARARAIWKDALPADRADAAPLRDYLHARALLTDGRALPAGRALPDGRLPLLRCAPRLALVPGPGRAAVHSGPVMVGALWRWQERHVTGVHLTWIDLDQPPKFRARLADPESGEPVPAKKMRGAMKGALIPVLGAPGASRWVIGEGIETVLAIAFAESTIGIGASFYAAAGSLGNLAGPRDPESDVLSSTQVQTLKNGQTRRRTIPGPVPAGETGTDCLAVAPHVESLVLLADGDSDREFTASAMLRARARHLRPGRTVAIVWPGRGDFADRLAGIDANEDGET